MILRHIFILLPLFFIFQSTIAQDNDDPLQDTILIRQEDNHISTTVTLEGEIRFFYERVFWNSSGLEVLFGFRFGDTLKPVGPLYFSEDKASWYSGFHFGLAYRRYFRWGKDPGYISLSGLYKNYSYPQHTISHLDIFSGGPYSIKSGQKQVVALKLLVGKKWLVPISENKTFNIDLFFGLGVRQRTIDNTIYAMYDSDSQPNYFTTPEKEKYSEYLPSLHLGVKFGIGF